MTKTRVTFEAELTWLDRKQREWLEKDLALIIHDIRRVCDPEQKELQPADDLRAQMLDCADAMEKYIGEENGNS